MSSKAPIAGDPVLQAEFQKALLSKDTFGFMQIGIDQSGVHKFELLASERSEGPLRDWSAMKALSKEKRHTFFVTMDITDRGLERGICVLIHWGPDLSPVKDRMLYASSRATLKGFLGSTNFSTPDHYASTAEELVAEAFVKQRSLHLDIDFRSEEEKEKDAACIEASAKSASASIMQRLPTVFGDDAKAAVADFQSDAAKSAVFSLTGDSLNVFTGASHRETSLEFLSSLLKEKVPCYLMFWYTRVRGAESTDPVGEALTKSVFAYYCPDGAERMAKFTYSTCKGSLVDYCNEIALRFGGKVEFTSIKDLTPDFMDYNLFPVIHSKATHAKPTAPGAKKKRKARKRLDV